MPGSYSQWQSYSWHSHTLTQPLNHVKKNNFKICHFVRLYVLAMLRTRFRVNPLCGCGFESRYSHLRFRFECKDFQMQFMEGCKDVEIQVNIHLLCKRGQNKRENNNKDQRKITQYHPLWIGFQEEIVIFAKKQVKNLLTLAILVT